MTKFFIVTFSALFMLGLFSWLASHYHWFDRRSEAADEEAPSDQEPAEEESTECCGQHLVCQKDKHLMAQQEIVYYDDEELDAYRHIPADQYPPEALEAFSEVFYSMPADDMIGWLNSLRLREVELPESLRDEALLILSEQRS